MVTPFLTLPAYNFYLRVKTQALSPANSLSRLSVLSKSQDVTGLWRVHNLRFHDFVRSSDRPIRRFCLPLQLHPILRCRHHICRLVQSCDGYVSLSCAYLVASTLSQIGLHLGQALHRRMWWLIPTVVTGGVGEILGWVGRLWGSREPTSMKPYLMQFVFLCSLLVAHSMNESPI